MNVRYLADLDGPQLRAAVDELRPEAGEALAVLVAEGGDPDLEQLVADLRDGGVPFFGGLFPGIVHGVEHHENGALLVRLPLHGAPVLVRGLGDGSITLPPLDEFTLADPGTYTAVVFVDGLTNHVDRLLVDLSARLANSVHYIGGGAGSLTLKQRPCVFTAEGVFQDAAVIGFVERRSHLGVRHGWQRHHGPLVATRASGNTIYELNWRPAWEVYRDAVAPELDIELTRDNFFQAATAYPFGIHKEGREDVVRDPVAVGDAGELVCVGGVPENAVLNILFGNRSTLVDAAARAGDDLRAAAPAGAEGALLMDCVSRTLFLKEDFALELATVRDRLQTIANPLPMAGALTLGEVSSHGEGFVEFLNKTIVAAVLYRDPA